MAPEILMADLARGEGIGVEFKRCGATPSADVYEIICAFANRQGGNIYLGIEDDGTVVGIKRSSIKSLEGNIIAVLGNPQLFDSAPAVEFSEIPIDEASMVLRLWIPPGPSVYAYKGVVYDRVGEADVRLRSVEQRAALFERKRELYTEREIFPYVTRADLRDDLIARARELAQANRPGHPWATMDDEALLKSARLFGTNRRTGERGYNRAAVLLLGNDEVIADICPSYKTDCISQVADAVRYDDREIVRTNLLDSYDRLAAFAERHLPDRFVLVGGQRVSARDRIVRELVANTLIHREYVSLYPAKLVINAEGISTENASRSIFEGRLTLGSLNPVSKNPIIAGFFQQIGWAEELGSGLRVLYDLAPRYGRLDPVFEEGDVFRAFVAVSPAGAHALDVEDALDTVLLANGVVTSAMLAAQMNVGQRTAQRHIRALVSEGVLVPAEGIPYAYRRA